MKPSSFFLSLVVLAVFSFAGARAGAADPDLLQREDIQGVSDYAKKIDDEYGYRQRIEGQGKAWAKDLMLMYKWPVLHPDSEKNHARRPISSEEVLLRLQSELAWITVTGHAFLATFDFAHGEQTLLGSTSRLVGALNRSAAFWLEIRNQCSVIDELKKAKGIEIQEDSLRICVERLQRDLRISQVVGSNVSLFIGGGLVVGLGRRLFQRFASKWVTLRILPLLPAFARTTWGAAGLLAAIVVLPTAVVVAGVSDEHQTNRVFFENLESALSQNTDDASKASILRAEALETEREVLELASWIHRHVPKDASHEGRNRVFIQELQLFAPHAAHLLAKRETLELRRDVLEKELRVIPGVSARLSMLADERKRRTLTAEEAKLFRRAQYLASLRLVLKSLPASGVAP